MATFSYFPHASPYSVPHEPAPPRPYAAPEAHSADFRRWSRPAGWVLPRGGNGRTAFVRASPSRFLTSPFDLDPRKRYTVSFRVDKWVARGRPETLDLPQVEVAYGPGLEDRAVFWGSGVHTFTCEPYKPLPLRLRGRGGGFSITDVVIEHALRLG